MDENIPATEPAAGAATELPQDVEQLLDQADVIAVLQQHGRALDAHRRELVLMWIAVLCQAGLLAYVTYLSYRSLGDA